MGARNTKENSNIWFMRIMFNKFVRNANPTDDGAEKRTNKTGKEVWECKYNTVDGYLTNISIANTGWEDAEQATFTLKDKDVDILLQIDLYSSVFRSVAKRLRNINAKKMVEFSVWEADYNGRSYTAITVRQDREETVQDYFKDSEELPKIEMVTIKGKETRDYTMQTEFLKLEVDKYNEKVGDWKPTFEVVHPTDASVPAPTQKDEPANTSNEDEDLPF